MAILGKATDKGCEDSLLIHACQLSPLHPRLPVFLSDSRKKFVAHERFQYILLKKFGETDVQVSRLLSYIGTVVKENLTVMWSN